jgi:hypothetical protein
MSTSGTTTGAPQSATGAILELTAQLELLALNAAVEANTRSDLANGDGTDSESLGLASLDTLLQEVRGTLNWAMTQSGEVPTSGIALSQLAQRVNQTVVDLEGSRAH